MKDIWDDKNLRWPAPINVSHVPKTDERFCEFHNARGHDTKDCISLKDEIERLVRDEDLWYFFNKFVKKRVKDDNPRRQPYLQTEGSGMIEEESIPLKIQSSLLTPSKLSS